MDYGKTTENEFFFLILFSQEVWTLYNGCFPTRFNSILLKKMVRDNVGLAQKTWNSAMGCPRPHSSSPLFL